MPEQSLKDMSARSPSVEPSFAERMAEASNGFFSAYVDSWDVLQIPRIGGFSGTVELPGSKSIANRALLLAALGTNPDRSCILKRLPDSDDVNVLRNILPALGVSVVAEEQGVRIQADHHRLSANLHQQ